MAQMGAQPPVVLLFFHQGEVVLGEVGVDEALQRSGTERGVGPFDGIGHEMPAEHFRQHEDRALNARLAAVTVTDRERG